VERLDKVAGAVRQPGDLRRALLLPEWRHTPDVTCKEVWTALAGRLEKSLRQVLQKGEPARQAAALALLGDVTVEYRQLAENVPIPRQGIPLATWWDVAVLHFPERLLPDVQALAAEGTEAEVRGAAGRTLGRIDPLSPSTLQALRNLLTGREAVERRAGLEGLALVVAQARDLGRPLSRMEFPLAQPLAPGEDDHLVPSRVLERAGREAAAGAGAALRDDDREVRRRAMEVLRSVAEGLAAAMPILPDLPPATPFMPPNERAELTEQRNRFEKQIDILQSLAQALDGQVRALVRATHASRTEVTLEGCRTLKALAHARRQLRAAAAALSLKDRDPLPTLPREAAGVGRLLADNEVRVRLAALYALETLEADAAPALDSVVGAAGDPDPFVRWGVARVLLSLGAQDADKIVPAAGKLLDDASPNVRLSAAKVLERYGPRSRPAVEKLAEAAQKGDAAVRVGALRALAAVGPDARPAVPALVRALEDAEPSVRAAAVRALARIGAAGPAEKALRKALDDPDLEVRQAASDALLGDR
jgi:hypothetical protein